MWNLKMGSKAGIQPLVVVMICAYGLMAFSHAGAQEAEDKSEPLMLEEVKVTARKREESLQEIPESITVFSGEQLETANVVTMRDFIDLTPNMIIRETFRSNESFLTMRGIASAQGALPPVAIVIDGVQVGANEFLNQDLLDIERVEVLRGPQGALYGQGAIAGAINIVTRAPTNEFESFVTGSYGNADTYRIAGSVSGPLIKDSLFGRVSAYYKSTDGLIKNRFGVRTSFAEEYSLRGRLLYEGENFSAAFRASHTEGDGSCCLQDKANFDPITGLLINIDDVTNPGAESNILGTDDTYFTDASMKLDYDFNGLTATSITGFAEAGQSAYADLDYTAEPIQIQDLSWDSEVINQEFRLASDSSSPFQWIVGGFYQKKKEIFDAKILRDQTQQPLPVLFAFINEINSDLWAVFGQASYRLTDKLELTGAWRYDRDEQDFVNQLVPSTARSATFDQPQPKLQMSYDWSDNVMTYATWSKGFRTGGFDQNQQFENEVATNYEIGIKSATPNGLMTINASLFHIDYENQQLSFVILDPDDATNTLRGVLNIPATDIDGMELEIAANPVAGLSINLGVGVAITSIAEVDTSSPFASPEAIGKTSPLAPPFTFNAGTTYTYPLNGNLDLLLYGQYRRQGGFYFDLNNTIKTGTQDFIDAKISLEGSNWSLGLFGRNLSDTRHATNVSITGSRLRVPNQPRSYGIEGTIRY